MVFAGAVERVCVWDPAPAAAAPGWGAGRAPPVTDPEPTGLGVAGREERSCSAGDVAPPVGTATAELSAVSATGNEELPAAGVVPRSMASGRDTRVPHAPTLAVRAAAMSTRTILFRTDPSEPQSSRPYIAKLAIGELAAPHRHMPDACREPDTHPTIQPYGW